MFVVRHLFIFFFFNDTATTEIYTLSLHDALPISSHYGSANRHTRAWLLVDASFRRVQRSEEHTSELQSQSNLVCRLLLEKKKNRKRNTRDPMAARTPVWTQTNHLPQLRVTAVIYS